MKLHRKLAAAPFVLLIATADDFVAGMQRGMRTKYWTTLEVVHVLIRRAPSGGEAVFDAWKALQGGEATL